jgi:hypothetical protein
MPDSTRRKMEQDLSYLRSDYAREKMIEQYHLEEEEQNTAKEKGATARAGIMLPPERPTTDDDRQNN